jgi:hypothetical protein
MNRLNIDHLITLYRRSDASRLPDVSTNSITSAVRRSQSQPRLSLFDPAHPVRFISALAGAVCGIFFLVFFLVSRPAPQERNIAINISRDRISTPAPRMERLLKKESPERFVYIGRDGRNVTVKL